MVGVGGGWGETEGASVSNGGRVAVWEAGKVLGKDGGDDCTK